MKFNFFIYFLAFTASMSGFLFGIEIGIINQVLQFDSFRITMGLATAERTSQGTLVPTPDSADREGWIVSLFLLGAIPGAASIAWFASWIGRRFSILLGATIFTIGGVLQGAAVSYEMMLASRFIGGLGVGLLSGVAPMYIAELSPAAIRGRLTALQQLMITIGIAVANIINAILGSTMDQMNDNIWRISLGIQAVFGFYLMLAMLWMPFSPRWLMDKNRDEQALKTLERIYGQPRTTPEVQQDFDDIKESMHLERRVGNVGWLELFKRGIFNRLVIAVMLQTWQQWTGINAVMYYSSALFIGMGFAKNVATTVNTTISSVVNVVATLPALWLVERLGRRPLLIVGGFGMAVSMSFLTGWVHGFEGTMIPDPATGLLVPNPNSSEGLIYGILGAIALYIFVVFFASTWGPIAWIVQSEIMPFRVRSKGVAIATMANWINNFIIAKVWPYAIANLGANQYLVFVATGIAMGVFTWLWVPETRGKTLEEMDAVFGVAPGEETTIPQHRRSLTLGEPGRGKAGQVL